MPGMLREFLTVQMQTDDGIEGIGVTGFGGKTGARAEIGDRGFWRAYQGRRPAAHRANHRQAARRVGALRPRRHRGPGHFGDRYRACGTSAARPSAFPWRGCLGGLRDKVPAYASGALTRTTPTDKLERAAAALVEKGYSARSRPRWRWKGLTPTQEVERIRLIRDAVGPDVNLMVDINQRWSVRRGDFDRPPRRGAGPRLAGGPDPMRRLPGPRRDRRRLDDADLRRRISLRHRAASADDDRITPSTSS